MATMVLRRHWSNFGVHILLLALSTAAQCLAFPSEATQNQVRKAAPDTLMAEPFDLRGPDVRPGEPDALPGWLGEVPPSRTQVTLRGEERPQGGLLDLGNVVQLSTSPDGPRAFLYKKFLTEEECDHIIKLATPKLERSSVADNFDGSGFVSEIRTSSGMFIDKAHDDIIARIEDRIAAWTFLPKQNGEALQVLRYEKTQKYEPHFDYFFDEKNKQQGGHRYATVLMYLNDVPMGGETIFPNAKNIGPKDDTWSECGKQGLGVKARKGDALLFYSLHPDGTPDEMSLHYACPVVEGVKWSAPKWIHVRSFDPPPIGDPNSCEDADPRCGEWAAQGECKQNPQFMVGDKSYLGSCRKSCKVCSPSSVA